VAGEASVPGVTAATRGSEGRAIAVAFTPTLAGLAITAAVIALAYLIPRLRRRRPRMVA